MGSFMDKFNREFFDKGRRRPVDLAVASVATCIAFYELVKAMPVKGFNIFDMIAYTAVVYYCANMVTALLHDVADLFIKKER